MTGVQTCALPICFPVTITTFASIRSDKLFLLSTDLAPYQEKITPVQPIDFESISKYEPTHNTYVGKIEPNTYALVRGEVLTDLIRSIFDLLQSHEHNVVGPLVQNDKNFLKLQEKINTLENDLLNSSIRIN